MGYENPQTLTGKKIVWLDDSACNLWVMTLEDGAGRQQVYTLDVEAVGSGLYGPVLYVGPPE